MRSLGSDSASRLSPDFTKFTTFSPGDRRTFLKLAPVPLVLGRGIRLICPPALVI